MTTWPSGWKNNDNNHTTKKEKHTMYKALAILGILFAIFATLAGAGGGCFGRGKSTPPPQDSTVYYKSTGAPVKQHTAPRKVVF